jgi:hypothetical protein
MPAPPKLRLSAFGWLVAAGLAGLSLGFCGPAARAQTGAASQQPAAAQAVGRSLADWQSYAVQMGTPGLPTFARLQMAVKVSRAVERSSEQSSLAQALARKVEDTVKASYPNLDRYPRLERVHGHEEPTWLGDRGNATAQAVLALSALERWKPDALRRATLQKLSDGLAALQRKERIEYPFGAHLSWEDHEPMTLLDDGTRVPSTYYQGERAYAVEALAEAADVLKDKELLASAEREALGMSTHVVIGGKPLDSFSPQPEYSNSFNAAIPIISGYLALYQVTGKPIYADLAALGTIGSKGRANASDPEWKPLLERIAATPAASLLKARSNGEPITSQIMEAEDGKVVNRAIETLGFETPSGERGTLASMGRQNTFWMRFDVPTEDDYVFYLTYLQSDVGGGLVSVMMRIDGDKIFQVPLGDVDGRPIMRRKFVDGPRPLRAGPHSFGIRFSGLLMTKPALLDSVVVQPAVERREFTTVEGDRLVLMRNVTGEVARTDRAAYEPWPAKAEVVVDGEGAEARIGQSEERRRRKHFLTLPPYGVAILRLAPGPARTE